MSLHNIPRILIAANSSGSGKTLFTCGLLELMKQLNKYPVGFKCGPDYIDPMFHRKVLGVEGSNLDSFFSSKDELRRLVDNSNGEIAVIEGVMGIYDGSDVSSYAGSCYEVAQAVGSKIILLVDAKGMGRTVISVIKGILADDECQLIKGIILNRMSGYYFEKIRDTLANEIKKVRSDVIILGNVPKLEGINLDSRHLGLKMPHEIEDIREQIGRVADSIRDNIDIDKLIDISNTICSDYSHMNHDLEKSESKTDEHLFSPSEYKEIKRPLTLAVARDDAFCFYYKENLELFKRHGVEITYFSPMHDTKVPKADGLLLGGGYPELHLATLSSNRDMRDSVKKLIDRGIPTLAECGGFMYLHNAIRDEKNNEYPMTGVVDASCSYTSHLVRFGYITLEGNDDINGMKAHEFHYYDSTYNGDSCIASKPDGSKNWPCIISDEVSYWGFPHMYYNSKPEFIERFIENMRKYNERFE